MHRAPSIFEQILIGVREQDDRLFGVIHEFVREAGLIVNQEGNTVFTGNILRGDDRKFIPRYSGAIANAQNSPARRWATHRDSVEHSRKFDIVHILRAAGNFLPALFARHGFSDDPGCHRVRLSTRFYPLSISKRERLRALPLASSESRESSVARAAAESPHKSANHRIQLGQRPTRCSRNRRAKDGPSRLRPSTSDKARKSYKSRNPSIRSCSVFYRLRESRPLPRAL